MDDTGDKYRICTGKPNKKQNTELSLGKSDVKKLVSNTASWAGVDHGKAGSGKSSAKPSRTNTVHILKCAEEYIAIHIYKPWTVYYKVYNTTVEKTL